MKYPNMRLELIECLESLSDVDSQVRNWVNGECVKEGRHDCFDYSINFLFDDTSLASNPRALIGVFLKNSEEAEAISSLCNSIDAILKKYGNSLTDGEYIGKPEWPSVVKNASESLLLIKKFDCGPDPEGE